MKVSETIYQASKDGFMNTNFNEKCCGKENTVICIIDKEDNIFGCYHSVSLPTISESEMKDIESIGVHGDEKHFMFVLKNKENEELKIYKRKEKGYSFWMFGSIENILSINGAVVLPHGCENQETAIVSGNYMREYGVEWALEKKCFGVKDIVVVTFQ